jgi:uncharacterized protein YcfJ
MGKVNDSHKMVLVGAIGGAILGHWIGEGQPKATAFGAAAGGAVGLFVSGIMLTNEFNLASQDGMHAAWQSFIGADFS